MTKTPAMPELPEPDYWSTRDDDTPLYTADQMRADALAALQSAQPAEVSDDAIVTAGHRTAWRYKHSSDPAHSSTYTFNRACLLQFARAILTQRPAAQATPDALAGAWDEGYRLGVADERTSEANIGVAGFGAKVNPARQNPYPAQQATPEPLTDTFVQTVPDKCDRIVWRGRYVHLPITKPEPVGEPLGYQRIFDAIGAATKSPAKGIVEVSVTGFTRQIGGNIYTHAAQPVPMTEGFWERFAGHLLDKHEGETITDEFLQSTACELHNGITAQAKGSA